MLTEACGGFLRNDLATKLVQVSKYSRLSRVVIWPAKICSGALRVEDHVEIAELGAVDHGGEQARPVARPADQVQRQPRLVAGAEVAQAPASTARPAARPSPGAFLLAGLFGQLRAQRFVFVAGEQEDRGPEMLVQVRRVGVARQRARSARSGGSRITSPSPPSTSAVKTAAMRRPATGLLKIRCPSVR